MKHIRRLDPLQTHLYGIDEMKTIHEYLPSKIKPKRTFIQGKIPTEIFEEVKKVMEQMDYSWPDILTASLKRFLDEVKKK